VSDETIGQRLRRLRRERGLSQRDLASPGISYAYISRIEADKRVPSVKALRKIAGMLGVTVEHLEIGEPTPTERGVADAGVDFETLSDEELRAIRARAAVGAREAARLAALDVIEARRQTEMEQLRKRLEELERTTPKGAGRSKGGSR
jgi:transcriptional regulator with XRE-family HTH domain